jgi:hypothetical protein
MADHTHNALGSMSYALEHIVAPAVDANDPIALEQLQSAVRYLEFLQQRLDLLPAVHRAELRQHADLAVAVLPGASTLSPTLADALAESVDRARAQLVAPEALVSDLRAATAALAALLSDLVRASESSDDDGLRAQIGHSVVAASRHRTLLERAWYLPLGFDQSPDHVPRLESLLAPRVDAS